MENFNNFRFNPRRYEEQLSVLGRKVFNVLVQKWRSDQSRLQQSQHTYHNFSSSNQKKRVLTDDRPLRTSRCSSPPMICRGINSESDFHNEQTFNFNVIEKNLPQQHTIPTTSELVQTLNNSDNADLSIGEGVNGNCSDFINPVIEKQVPTVICNEMLIDEPSHTYKPLGGEKSDVDNDIDWDNMFDTELFSTEDTISNAKLVLEQIEAPVDNFNVQFPCEVKTPKIKGKAGEPKGKVRKNIKRNNFLITDAIPKKVKKVADTNEPKISFRKQKYTKAVKNWLHDVELNKDHTEIIEQNAEPAQIEITIEKDKQKPKKKVVQARLANKDGIMKFKKPRIEITKSPVHDNNSNISTPPNENHREEYETPEKNRADNATKDKTAKESKSSNNTNKVSNGKPKFVAPIKSQIPIKEVEYHIVTADGNDNDEIQPLRCIEDQDLIIVIMYSNGFCQLNKHHTEDTCDPEGFIIQIGDGFFYFKGDHQIYKPILQTVLEKNKIICYNGKDLLIYFKSKYDLDTHKINMIDAEIGGSILDPDNPPENFSELQKQLSFTPEFTIATQCVLQKTAWYATLLMECTSKLVTLMMQDQLWDVFMNIEMKLLPIIADMERLGVSVDLQKLKQMEDILLTKMKDVELECHKAAGKTFQINSPMQVRAIIYDELKLDAKCNMKIRETIAQGAKSTSESMLRGLVSVHPLPRLILEYRHLHKAHATFLTGIAQHVKDGIVRPTWVQTAAATGRIASNNPNLQAIPKAPFSLVLFPEFAEGNDTSQEALSFRSVYRARAGRRLLACDFKHVECRVFAHAAADDALLAVLRHQDDIFRALAQKWLNKAACEVSVSDRERTKRIVYASLYGAGVRKLMEILNVGYDQALAVHTSFNRTFPSLKRFGSDVVSGCAARGGRLATARGRARAFPRLACAEPAARAHAERQAVNFIIQGSAADLCKTAMVEACGALARAALDARLLLQIHDELVWEVLDEHLPHAAVVIKRAMEECGRASGMQDPLPVALSAGRDWGHMADYRTE